MNLEGSFTHSMAVDAGFIVSGATFDLLLVDELSFLLRAHFLRM